MALIIGTDEAGYGPNLGPLVVAATSFGVPSVDADLDAALANVFCRQRSDLKNRNGSNRWLVADSKVVYRGGNLAPLETVVLAVLGAATGTVPTSLVELLALCGDDTDDVARQFWYREHDDALPVACDVVEVQRCRDRLKLESAKGSLEMLPPRVRAVFPDGYNKTIQRTGNKATLLSETTLKLVHHVLEAELSEVALVRCDKHGGRSRYADLLSQFVTTHPIVTEIESRSISRYRWANTTAEFLVGGELHFPVALASMIAKYIRELCMNAWNRYWMDQIPGLRPTKGYPVDARRFRADIADCQQRLGIADEQFWRSADKRSAKTSRPCWNRTRDWGWPARTSKFLA